MLPPDSEAARTTNGTLRVTAMAVMLLVLSALDLITTEVLLQLGSVELNPLMAPFLGTGWALFIKLGLPVAVVLASLKANTTLVARALKLAVLVYIAVTVFNIGQLLAVSFIY